MSKNIILNNQTYNNVSQISLPIEGGKALFKDVDEIAIDSSWKQTIVTFDEPVVGAHTIESIANVTSYIAIPDFTGNSAGIIFYINNGKFKGYFLATKSGTGQGVCNYNESTTGEKKVESTIDSNGHPVLCGLNANYPLTGTYTIYYI